MMTTTPPRLIGMLHLPPLPGSPRFGGDLSKVRDFVLRDAEALAAGGVDALMLENFGDTPFYPGAVPAHVIAHMTALADDVMRQFPLPMGINVLRNDGCAALSIAHALGAQFVRVNILTGARVTDQGILQGIAHDLLRLRRMLDAPNLRIFADVNVKHSAPLGAASLDDEIDDVMHRGGADALIVTGAGTGKAADLDELKRVAGRAGQMPVYVGSGVSAETIGELLQVADGVIVGTSLKTDGIVDTRKVKALVAAAG
jgi:hypothetical protein